MPGRTLRRTLGFGVPLAAVAILAAACGGGSPTASTGGGSSSTGGGATSGPASSAPASSASSGGQTVTLKTETGTAGVWLSDQTGRTLYIYTADQGTTSTCYGACATAWPPLLSSGQVSVSGSAVAADLGSTKRTDGTTQVTYAGHPLYYFKNDTSPGQTKGQGLQGVWFLLGPTGNVMKGAASAPTTGGGSGGGGSGGGGGGGGGWA